jgi:transcriptional regulator with XRE-family HTH domain
MADKTIGANIRRFREARSLVQKDLAEMIGKNKNTISNWELGLRDPGSDNIKKIAAALEISPSELIGHNEGVLQDSTFEVICTDIAMHPDIRPGDRLLVDKAKKPKNGDVVVAGIKGHDMAPVVRVFITVEDMNFLLPVNRLFPCEPISNFDLLGKVVEVTRKL